MAILQSQLATMTREQLEAMVLSAHKPRKLNVKVSEKGAVSVYGLGRFPITLYRSQMERLLDSADDIRAFMVANVSLLAVKE